MKTMPEDIKVIGDIEVQNNSSSVDKASDEYNRDDKHTNNVFVLTVKLLLIGLSAVYLMYEMIAMTRMYSNYNTLQVVSYGRRDHNHIPSVTVCLPTLIDKNKLLAKYPELTQKLNSADSDDHPLRNRILAEYLDKALDSVDVWPALTIAEKESMNCSLNYWSIKGGDYSNDYYKHRIGMNCREIVRPIESYSKRKTKCFTYFSRLNADKRFSGEYSLRYGVKDLNNIYNIIDIELELDFDRYLTLGFVTNESTVAIHHQNIIADDMSEALVLEAGHRYEIIINKITTQLLEKPYKTECRRYDGAVDDIHSKQQCIDDCIIHSYEDICHCIPMAYINTVQVLNRSHVVCSQTDSSLRTNTCYEELSKSVGLCLTSGHCPNECQTIRYKHRSKVTKIIANDEEMDPKAKNNDRRIAISIALDVTVGDEDVTHIPLMTFGQLLAYMSAFIAAFTGLSLMAVVDAIVAMIPDVGHTSRCQISAQRESSAATTVPKPVGAVISLDS